VSSESGVSDSGGSGAACKAESIIELGEITKYSVWGKGNAKDSIQDCFMLLVAPVCSEYVNFLLGTTIACHQGQ
jgi:hypothetical protein